MQRLNKKLQPRQSSRPTTDASGGKKFFRSYNCKLSLAEKPRPKVSSPVTPQTAYKRFVSSTDLLKNLIGLSSGMLTTRGEAFTSSDKAKRLLITDGVMQRNGYLNRPFIQRLSQLVSGSSPPSKGSSPNSHKVTAFELN
jgi:hypothetical protein